MFCPECGIKNLSQAAFCAECGTKLVEESVSTSATQPVIPPNNFSTDSFPNTASAPKTAVPTPLSKHRKIILAQLLLIVLLAFSFYKLGSHYYSPETIASSYFELYIAENWDALYEYYELPDSPFLTKELFSKSQVSFDKMDVTNFTVTRKGSETPSALTTSVSITYLLKGSSNEFYYELDLVKQKGKKLFFFDDWTLDTSSILSDSFQLSCPTGSTITFDGVTLTGETPNTTVDSFQTGRDNYVIDTIFTGLHSLEASKPDYETYSKEIEVYELSGGYYDVYNLSVSGEIKEKLVQLSAEYIETYYNNAINRTSFDTMIEWYSTDNDCRKYAQSDYTYYVNSITNDDGTGIQSIAFNNLTGSVESSSDYYADYDISVTITGDYTINKTSKHWYYETIDKEVKNGVYTATFKFVNEDGSWLLINDSIGQIY